MDDILRPNRLIGMAEGTRFMSNMKLEHNSELSFSIVLILKGFKLRSTWKKSGGKKGVAPSDFYYTTLKMYIVISSSSFRAKRRVSLSRYISFLNS